VKRKIYEEFKELDYHCMSIRSSCIDPVNKYDSIE
jgi:hypothetical protein